jgi:hypothetical protein
MNFIKSTFIKSGAKLLSYVPFFLKVEKVRLAPPLGKGGYVANKNFNYFIF